MDTQKQKELANALVYDLLKLKTAGEDLNTYIKGAIDCKKVNQNNNKNSCNNDNKYGVGKKQNRIIFKRHYWDHI
ncbi:Mlp family lipoprotein [Borreliella valaisiana]|uniref:Mlp family lipoprotein n=1 Tax=Borreliella valaisiana TaxID=62088 RepID=UPI002ED28082|nr:Mlp family lipoprotein [Borreliella valaisiana]